VPPARVLLYVATIGALALLARSLLVEPISMDIAALALVFYVGLVTCGTLVLRLGMFADVTWRGPKNARGVALTFDDGPSPEHTPKILQLLDDANVKATFFVIGKKADQHPAIVRSIKERGHALGVHGYAHDRFFSFRAPAFVRDDLERAIASIERITGDRPRLFRPPIGHTNARIAAAAKKLELAFVGWSIAGFDGLGRARPERVAARVVPKLRDGSIVLLHDAAERDDFVPPSVAALPRILEAMERKNLPGVTVEAWVEENG
jgi:peptidoglycan/xylan/chitin deacetylase (PgdA/CDA1 family)